MTRNQQLICEEAPKAVACYSYGISVLSLARLSFFGSSRTSVPLGR